MLKNKSVTFKLSFYILSFSGIVFIILTGYNYHISKTIILKNVHENAEMLGSSTVGKIEMILRSTAKIPENLAFALETGGYSKDELETLLNSVVKNNPEIYGSCIGFEPFVVDKNLEYFAPYSYRSGQKIIFSNIGGKDYQYFFIDWYQMPKILKKPIWTEPYFDDGGGNIIMTTYSVPFYRLDGDKKVFSGIVTVDISVSWLEKIVSEIKILKTGYAFLISRNGTIITHPQKSFIMNETIFSIAEEKGDPEIRNIGRDMINGGSGFRPANSSLFQKPGWIYYTSIPFNGWSLGIFFPSDELFEELENFSKAIIVIAFFGIVALLSVIIAVTRKITSPLRMLATAAVKIGGGDFNTALPEISSGDEIGKLTQSFGMMQKHLARYIGNLRETTAAKEKIESELRIAHDIQMSIIPKLFPPFPDRREFDLFGILEPAKSVGGDLYDFFLINDRKLCIAVGDVSGKGVPASLFMAITRTLLRAKALSSSSPREIVSGINNDLCRDNDMSMFVTFFIGVFDIVTGELSYTNAGHYKPYVIGDDGQLKTLLNVHGMPLGINESEYLSSNITLSKNDKLIMYTDGVTEATNPENQLYSEARLEKMICTIPSASPKTIISELMKDIKSFVAGAEQSDDITILILQFSDRS